MVSTIADKFYQGSVSGSMLEFVNEKSLSEIGINSALQQAKLLALFSDIPLSPPTDQQVALVPPVPLRMH
jgi:hypothetical protein